MDVLTKTITEQREIEQYFGACLYLDPLGTLKASAWLPAEYIQDERIRTLWERAKEQLTPTMQPNQAQEFITNVSLGIGIDFSLKLADDSLQLIGYTSRSDAYAQEISSRARNVQIGALLPDVAQAIANHDHDRVDSFVHKVSGMTRTNAAPVRTAGDIHQSFVEFVNNRGRRSISTFIPGLDAALGGLARQNLAVIGARPSMGKTGLAWQFARDIAIGEENVAFFSLEMSETDLWLRAACPEVGVSSRDVVANRLTDEQRRKLIRESEAMQELLGGRLMLDDRIQTTATIWQYVAGHRPDLVIVDHLRLLQDKVERGVTENKRLGMVTENLKNLAKSFNCAVLCLAQLNRQVETQADKQPTLKDLRDSGEIEENADVVMFIHSPDFYDDLKQNETTRGVQLWVEKNRNGQRNIKINLLYDLVKQRFYPAMTTTTNLNGQE